MMNRTLLVLGILISTPAMCANFELKWTIPDGIHIYVSYVLAYDTDHDGNEELLFTSENLRAPVIYELEGDSFILAHVIDSIPIWSLEVWGVGDFDRDTFSDVFVVYYEEIGGFHDYFRVYESRAPDAFPDTLVCDFLLPHQAGVRNKTRVADLDGDGRTEIIDVMYDHEDVWFYENTGDNTYELVAVDTLTGLNHMGAPALGDFDEDGRMELACSDMYGGIAVLENVGDDEYEVVFQGSIPTFTRNVYDNLPAPDMDRDGKPEIVLHGFTAVSGFWRDDIFVYEAIADNDYELVFYDSLWPNYTWPEVGAVSKAGDVTGDGIPELVLSTTGEIYIFKAVGDDMFEVIWNRNIAQEVGQPIQTMNQLNVEIWDLDHNGLNDIVVSVNYDAGSMTFVYEWDELCGDADGDGMVTSADGFSILNFLGAGPYPMSCWVANVNGDGVLTPSDGYHLLNFLGSGPEPTCAPCEF